MGAKQYSLSILKDHKGDPSSSRWLAFLGFAVLVALIAYGAHWAPTNTHKLIIELANVLQWLVVLCVLAGQGASAAKELGKKISDTPTTPTPTTPTPTAPGSAATPPAGGSGQTPPVQDPPSMGFPPTDTAPASKAA